ncbi:MAG TPA: hypothetical protein VJT75_18170, partial [Thermoleophilaceae bacterium]|nr:hypothetical protein [Thermoleophilaceae bacterium]
MEVSSRKPLALLPAVLAAALPAPVAAAPPPPNPPRSAPLELPGRSLGAARAEAPRGTWIVGGR